MRQWFSYSQSVHSAFPLAGYTKDLNGWKVLAWEKPYNFTWSGKFCSYILLKNETVVLSFISILLLEANDLQKKQGKGDKSNAAEALTDDEVNILCEKYLH